MSLIKFKNIETTKLITLDTHLKTLSSSGRELFIQDSAVFAVFIQLLTLKTSVISYKTIANLIKEQKSKYHMDDCSNSIIANKYIFKVRTLLKSVMVEDFIVTVRGLGYKISNKWLSVQEEDNNEYNKSAFLKEITLIIDDCIIYTKSVSIVQDKSGFTYIKPSQDIVINNFNRMNDCYHSFLSQYSTPGNSAELIDLREKITKVLLYAIYWRVGDSLSDEKFRADYKNELQFILKQVIQAVTLLD
ncbi:helix-turn-helix domain-containing protein [Psychromonas sp. SP041]|uniref:helix-turn-helix domain-containing protein n=1 Tax=Psychromonas sp. SP041 TaxID=1365007 RepID=UPI0010C7CD4E|nr:helix-turn-helix domain-containing protein [Psychromonas sp. SP041]